MYIANGHAIVLFDILQKDTVETTTPEMKIEVIICREDYS